MPLNQLISEAEQAMKESQWEESRIEMFLDLFRAMGQAVAGCKCMACEYVAECPKAAEMHRQKENLN